MLQATRSVITPSLSPVGARSRAMLLALMPTSARKASPASGLLQEVWGLQVGGQFEAQGEHQRVACGGVGVGVGDVLQVGLHGEPVGGLGQVAQLDGAFGGGGRLWCLLLSIGAAVARYGDGQTEFVLGALCARAGQHGAGAEVAAEACDRRIARADLREQ